MASKHVHLEKVEAAYQIAKTLSGHFDSLFKAVHNPLATFKQRTRLLQTVLSYLDENFNVLDRVVRVDKLFPARSDGTADVYGPNMHAALVMLSVILVDTVNEECGGAADTSPNHKKNAIRKVFAYLASLAPFDLPKVWGGLMADRALALERISEYMDLAVWITVSKAAIASGANRGTIQKAADSGRIKSNGKTGADRRVDSADLVRWMIEKAKRPEPKEHDETVERKLDNRSEESADGEYYWNRQTDDD